MGASVEGVMVIAAGPEGVGTARSAEPGVTSTVVEEGLSNATLSLITSERAGKAFFRSVLYMLVSKRLSL